MKLSDVPAKFSIPFANGAGGGYITYPVPQAPQSGGRASLTDGFPPPNWLPVGAGGIPPWGQDFNGLLKQVTLWNQWNGAGAVAAYDGSFSTAIGGYPQGAILSGEYPGSVWLNLVDDNTTDPTAGGAGWTQLLTSLSAPVTLYVRSDGSDSNDGSANTAGSAFETLNGAITYARNRFGVSAQQITIQIGLAGTYAKPSALYPGSTFQIRGDPANATAYVIQNTTNAVVDVENCYVRLDGLTLEQTVNGNNWLDVISGAAADVGTVWFINAGATTGSACIRSAYGSSVRILGTVTMGANGSSSMLALGAASINAAVGSVITYSGNPIFSDATVRSDTASSVILSPATMSGAAQGSRYSATVNGVIYTNGGANFIPGNAVGTTASGGQYV